MKMRIIFLLLAIIPVTSFIQDVRGVTDKDLETALSPTFLLNTLRGVAAEVPDGGIGCGLSSSFALDTLQGSIGNRASGTSGYFTLDTRRSDLGATPTPTPTDNSTPTPTPTDLTTDVQVWESY